MTIYTNRQQKRSLLSPPTINRLWAAYPTRSPVPLRVPLRRFLPRPLHPIFSPLRSHALHACVTTQTVQNPTKPFNENNRATNWKKRRRR